MKIYKKSIIFLVLIILFTFVILPMNSQNINSMAYRKINPEVLQTMEEKPNDYIEVFVSYNGDIKSLENKVSDQGVNITDNWDFINVFAAKVKAKDVLKIAEIDDIKLINKDSEVSFSNAKDYKKDKTDFDSKEIVNVYNHELKVDKVWKKGYKGEDVTIAIIDSGINHNGNDDFSSRVIEDVNINPNSTSTADEFGHGTFIAGVCAGDGTLSQGKYVGIAPESNLINVKFCDDEGNASEKDLLNALQWVYDNKEKYNIKVANISSNASNAQSYNESAVCAAVEMLWNNGIVVVVSAGNGGEGFLSTSMPPANDPYVITVGSVDDNKTKNIEDDNLKDWSSRGITIDGFSKPDIVAPGSHIVSYMPIGELKQIAPGNIVDDYYFEMGGTSVSAPMVSGVAALILQAHPDWTSDQVKSVIINKTRDYMNRPDGTSKIAAADKTVFYRGEPFSANQNNVPSYVFYCIDEDILPSNMTWSNMTWSNMTWSNMTWSNMTWSNMTWSNMTWSNMTWSNMTWSNMTWSNMTWSNMTWSSIIE